MAEEHHTLPNGSAGIALPWLGDALAPLSEVDPTPASGGNAV